MGDRLYRIIENLATKDKSTITRKGEQSCKIAE